MARMYVFVVVVSVVVVVLIAIVACSGCCCCGMHLSLRCHALTPLCRCMAGSAQHLHQPVSLRTALSQQMPRTVHRRIAAAAAAMRQRGDASGAVVARGRALVAVGSAGGQRPG